MKNQSRQINKGEKCDKLEQDNGFTTNRWKPRFCFVCVCGGPRNKRISALKKLFTKLVVVVNKYQKYHQFSHSLLWFIFSDMYGTDL